MCGIFACIPYLDEWLDNSIILHQDRGPDQNKKISFCGYGITVNRLMITGSITDGSQPVFSSSGNFSCVFNGAIFNAKKLIMNYSLVPKSKNDASVVLELFEKIGKNCFDFIEGMFSIIIMDKLNSSIVIARDTMGIKPLYWLSKNDVIIFSSSIKAVPEKFQPYVQAFPPGQVWVDGFFSHSIQPKVVASKDIETILLDNLKDHIPQEVSWACSLSGGIDSALICAMAKKLGYKFNCYTLDTGEGQDKEGAIYIADKLSLDLRLVKVRETDVENALPIIVKELATYDVQTVIGALLTYFISKAASLDNVKVLLFGEGADEAFGGYRKYIEALVNGQSDLHVRKIMAQDLRELWLTHNKRVDHASMVSSIEARVPYQANKVVLNAQMIPLKFKVNTERRLNSKILLRSIASKYLPKGIALREKTSISRGSSILKLLKHAVNNLHKDCTVQNSEKLKFNLNTKASEVLFSYWREFYPNLAINEEELEQRNLKAVNKKI